MICGGAARHHYDFPLPSTTLLLLANNTLPRPHLPHSHLIILPSSFITSPCSYPCRIKINILKTDLVTMWRQCGDVVVTLPHCETTILQWPSSSLIYIKQCHNFLILPTVILLIFIYSATLSIPCIIWPIFNCPYQQCWIASLGHLWHHSWHKQQFCHPPLHKQMIGNLLFLFFFLFFSFLFLFTLKKTYTNINWCGLTF